jgi:hypothetical protein
LDDLKAQSGEQAVTQRQIKGKFQAASRPSPAWTGSDITNRQGQRFGGMGGGMGSGDQMPAMGRGMGGMGGGGMRGGMSDSAKDADEDRKTVSSAKSQTANPLAPAGDLGYIRKDVKGKHVQAEVTAPKNPVQTIGDKTFYWKNDRWRDSDVTPEGEKHPIKIKAFSSQYFALAAKSDSQFAKYLSLEGPILIVLDGKTYLIEPAKDADE